MLKHRFLIRSLHHNWIVVDIASYSMSWREGEAKEQMVPSRRFGSWGEVERDCLALGATGSMIEEASRWLKKCSVAVLTIMDRPQESE